MSLLTIAQGVRKADVDIQWSHISGSLSVTKVIRGSEASESVTCMPTSSHEASSIVCGQHFFFLVERKKLQHSNMLVKPVFLHCR